MNLTLEAAEIIANLIRYHREFTRDSETILKGLFTQDFILDPKDFAAVNIYGPAPTAEQLETIQAAIRKFSKTLNLEKPVFEIAPGVEVVFSLYKGCLAIVTFTGAVEMALDRVREFVEQTELKPFNPAHWTVKVTSKKTTVTRNRNRF